MAHPTSRLFAAFALGTLALAACPGGAGAQTSTYYTPPKLIKQATTSVPIAGNGAVTVQVFVRKNGAIGTVTVKKSTNHSDDAAALDIAKNSIYKVALRDGKPIDAYYTMALKFNGSSVINDTGTTVEPAPGGQRADSCEQVRRSEDRAPVVLDRSPRRQGRRGSAWRRRHVPQRLSRCGGCVRPGRDDPGAVQGRRREGVRRRRGRRAQGEEQRQGDRPRRQGARAAAERQHALH